jgi:cephalosporin hydroxylase
MKKNLAIAFMFAMIVSNVFAKENLAILPFTGGQGNEGETVAELFSFDAQINEVFNPIPRTSITRAINNEQRFQMSSGMTDADTIVAIGHQLGARYVVAGSITSIGKNNLLVISIMDIRNLQQIAGDYQTYPIGRIQEIRGKLPGMATNIIRAIQENTDSVREELVIVPVQLEGGADQRVADALAQLLAIHLIRSGKYAVFPRTQSLDQVIAEHNTQMSGVTADRNIIGIGHGRNPDLVLSVAARHLGSVNMFNAVIINLLTGAQVFGRSVDYQNLDDGMRAMETLSAYLTGTTEQVTQRQQEEEKRRLAEKRKARAVDNPNIRLSVGADLFSGFRFLNSSLQLADQEEWSPFISRQKNNLSEWLPFISRTDGQWGFQGHLCAELFSYVLFDVTMYYRFQGGYIIPGGRFASDYDDNEHLYVEPKSYDFNSWGLSFSLIGQCPFKPDPLVTIFPFLGFVYDMRLNSKWSYTYTYYPNISTGWFPLTDLSNREKETITGENNRENLKDDDSLSLIIGGRANVKLSQNSSVYVKLLYDVFLYSKSNSTAMSEGRFDSYMYHGPSFSVGINYAFFSR